MEDEPDEHCLQKGTQHKEPAYNKYCAVPKCENTTKTAPDKVFFFVPRGLQIRKKWCKAMKRDMVNPTRVLYCCEDHFNIEEDTENLMRYRIMSLQGKQNVTLRLKKGVLPRCQKGNNNKPVPERSAFATRRRQELNDDALGTPYRTGGRVELKTPPPTKLDRQKELKGLASDGPNLQDFVPECAGQIAIETENVKTSLIVKQDQEEMLDEDEIRLHDVKFECVEIEIKCLAESIKSEPGVSEENEGVCRTCLCPCEDGVSLSERDEDLDATLGSLLAEVAGVVEHDQLPRMLCNACSRALRAAAAFRRRAIRADTTLRDKPRGPSLGDQANCQSEHLVCAPSLKDLFQLKDEPTVSLHLSVEKPYIRSVSPQYKEEPNKQNTQPETDSENFYWSAGEQERSPQRETRKRKIQLNRESFCSSDVESKRIERSSRRNKVRDGSWEPSDGDTDCHSSTGEDVDTLKENVESSKRQKKEKKINVARPGSNTAHKQKKRIRIYKNKLQCFECGMLTTCMAALNIHMRKHTDERPYKCPECSRQFRSMNVLKAHRQTHKPKSERARKFICAICGRDFYKRYHMIQHLAKHSSPQFVCQSCGHAFAWEHNLKAHQKRVHGEQAAK